MDLVIEQEESQTPYKNIPLSEFVVHTLENYFSHLEGEIPSQLYDMVIREVEKGFFKVLMHQAKGNQTLASEMSGLARGTLRKKLKDINML